VIKTAESIRARSASERAFRRILRTPVTVIGLVLVMLLILLAITADWLPIQDPYDMDITALRMPPGTPGHPLGTDEFGRDILGRVVAGSRISLVIALVSVAIGVSIGSLLGVIAGYMGGVVDSLISRTWDVLLTFPGIILYLVVVSALGPGIPMVIMAMVIGGIPGYGRLLRERVLSQRQNEYVMAATTIGASPWRIMLRHILPNCLTPILVAAALAIPGVIMGEAGLSYLGLGVPPPHPSWGKMIAEGQTVLESAPWVTIIPGVFILFATLGFNLLADGLRDYLDPTQLR
jgi:peptide/nickel transport system permease protein